MAMQHLGLQEFTASPRGQASHRPPQPVSTDSHIALCYADPAHKEVTQLQYRDMPSRTTGHRPLEVHLKVLQVYPAPSEDADQDGPPINPPKDHDTPKWTAYYRVVDRSFGHQADPDLHLTMRQAAAACGLRKKNHHEQEAATPRRDLRSKVSAMRRDKRDRHTAIHSLDLHTQQDAQRIAGRLEATHPQLREWPEHRAEGPGAAATKIPPKNANHTNS